MFKINCVFEFRQPPEVIFFKHLNELEIFCITFNSVVLKVEKFKLKIVFFLSKVPLFEVF